MKFTTAKEILECARERKNSERNAELNKMASEIEERLLFVKKMASETGRTDFVYNLYVPEVFVSSIDHVTVEFPKEIEDALREAGFKVKFHEKDMRYYDIVMA